MIGLYLNPGRMRAVFRVEEKTAIQALDRLDSLLPCRRVVLDDMASSITAIARTIAYGSVDESAQNRAHGRTLDVQSDLAAPAKKN